MTPIKKSLTPLDMASFIDAGLDQAERTFGKAKNYIAAEHEAKQLVLPIPTLSLQWLIESNGWPLGRYTQSGGPFGSFKSCFIFQLIAWFLANNGYVVHIDTENKMSDSLMKSLIPPQYFDKESPISRRFQIFQPATINEWQERLTTDLLRVKAFTGENGSFPIPVLYTLDSLSGRDSETQTDKIEETGEAVGKTFSDASILISQYLKWITGQMIGLPVCFHASHQEKPNLSTYGERVTRQGGKAPDFHETLDIRFSKGGPETARGKAGEYNHKSTGLQGHSVTLTIRKTSMGSDIGKSLTVDVCWIGKTENGVYTQRTWWEWNAATSMLLRQYSTTLDKQGIMDVHSVQKHIVGWCFWSDALGVKEDDALPAEQFGELIERSGELRKKVGGALLVQEHPEFKCVV